MNSLTQRLLAESSPWFKKAQIFLVFLLTLVNGLHTYIPADIISHINWIGIALIIFCSFTVNDANILATNGITMQSLFEMAATVPDQLQQLKDAVGGKLSLDQAKQLAGLQVQNPPNIVVVDPNVVAQPQLSPPAQAAPVINPLPLAQPIATQQ